MTIKEAMNTVYDQLTFRVNLIDINGQIYIYKKHDEEMYACCFFNENDSSASLAYMTLTEAKNWIPL